MILTGSGTLALVALPFAAGLCGFYPAWFRAVAQDVTEVRICGGCSCYDGAERSQCEANERAAYERANPPRGQMEGVCYATYGKWERDSQGNQVRREQSPIYSRFRYTESRVDGYHEVFAAWRQFVDSTYGAEFPNRDGWSWSPTCSVLGGGGTRHARDPQNWQNAQAKSKYQRVFMPIFGIADTPEERALEARLAKEREARMAEERRRADAKAAELARQQAAAEAKRRAEVSAMEAALGPGKRASAERLLAMNEQVAKFRPKATVPLVSRPSTAPSPSAKPARQCTRSQGTEPITTSAATRESAEASMRARTSARPGETILQRSVTAPTCTQRTKLYIKPPPVGTCLSCISEQMAKVAYGWEKGKGYPPPPTEWVCKAVVSYTAEKCETGPSKVSNQ